MLEAVLDPYVKANDPAAVPGAKGSFWMSGRSRLIALIRSARSRQRVAETLYRSRAARELEVRDKCRYDCVACTYRANAASRSPASSFWVALLRSASEAVLDICVVYSIKAHTG